MNRPFLVIVISLFFVGLAHSCTITPNSVTGVVGTQLTFTLSPATGSIFLDCGNGEGQKAGGSTFQCAYTSTGQKNILVTIRTDNSQETCSAFASISPVVSNSLPVVGFSSPSGGATVASGQGFVFTGSASDDGSVASLKLQIATDNSCGDGSWKTVTVANPWSYSWNNVPVGKSNCKANIEATDNLGLKSTVSVTFSTSAAQAGQPAAPQGQPCTPACSAKKKTMCVNGAAVVADVACCEASDCTATCTNGKYKAPTCGANTCSYATASYTAGQCNYVPGCSITRPSQTVTNANTILLVKFKNLTQNAPASVTLNCGNGKGTVANCTGARNGECVALCNYTRVATVTPSATLNEMTCETGSIAVAAAAVQNNLPAGAQALAQRVSCNLEFKTTALTTERVEVKINYNGTTMPPGLVNVKCGNGKIATAPGCISNVYGNGECSANCVYDAVGIYAPSTDIQGVNCASGNINIAGGTTQSNGEVNIQDVSTTPAVIVEGDAAVLNAAVKSSSAVKNVSCKPIDNSQSSCTCLLSQSIAPNPELTCAVQPPVKGTYEIILTTQDGKSKSILIPVTTSQTQTENSNSDNYTNYVLIAIIIVLLAGHFAYSKFLKH